MPGTVYIVGTPIGNLGDISPRVAETLGTVDFIAAEDTRVTLKLLNHLGLKKPMISCHEHNEKEKSIQIIQRVINGESCAVVSDAGMPGISDPGGAVIALCRQSAIPTVIIPGPSAVVSAVALCGFAESRFCFEGFLPVPKAERKARLAALAGEERLMVFYEAPHRIAAFMTDLLAAFGQRNICIGRELTKLHEEVIHTTLEEAAARYQAQAPRGEFVLVVEGAAPQTVERPPFAEAVARMRALMDGGMAASAAAKQTAAETGYPKGELYKAAQV